MPKEFGKTLDFVTNLTSSSGDYLEAVIILAKKMWG